MTSACIMLPPDVAVPYLVGVAYLSPRVPVCSFGTCHLLRGIGAANLCSKKKYLQAGRTLRVRGKSGTDFDARSQASPGWTECTYSRRRLRC